MTAQRTMLSVGGSLLVVISLSAGLGCGFWPRENAFDEKRCEPACPTEKVCFEGQCVACARTELVGQTCASLGFEGGTLECTPTNTFNTSACFKCGDDRVNGKEQCDGGELNGETCHSRALDGGRLACKQDCTFDLSGCTGCGNDRKELNEECDGQDLAGKDCKAEGFYAGQLKCTTKCALDTGSCHNCGNDTIDVGEQCDGKALVNADCTSQGFAGGKLTCGESCQWNTSGCYKCSDGTKNGNEDCDGADLGAETCKTQGFFTGALACKVNCTLDTSACHNCGDGNVDTGEQCDGGALGGKSCVALGFEGGNLACKTDCTFDITACHKCGDGIRNGSEACELSDLGGEDCSTQGFFTGTLTCKADCTFDAAGCHNCGNNTVDSGEICDGTQLSGKTCVNQGFEGGNLKCKGNCTFDATNCYKCGDGVVNGSEVCDLGDFAGQTCKSKGFFAGVLSCKPDCTLDISLCHNCGNNVIDKGEACDSTKFAGISCKTQGFDSGTLACLENCSKVSTAGCGTCGDGSLNGDEECETGQTKTCQGVSSYNSGSRGCNQCTWDYSQCYTKIGPILISLAPGTQTEPVVSHGGPSSLVVWKDERAGAGKAGIYAARVDDNGKLLDLNGIAISTAANEQSEPAIAFDGTNYLVVWKDLRKGTGQIYGARVTTSGSVLDPNGFQISNTTGGNSKPAVAFGGANFLVTWVNGKTGCGSIHAARVSVLGSVLDILSVQVASGTNRSPSISFDKTNYLVVWMASLSCADVTGTIDGARITTAGVLLDGTPITVSASTEGKQPAVAFDGTRYLVVWSAGYARKISGTFLDSTGKISGSTFDIAVKKLSVCTQPAILFGASRYLVGWLDNLGGCQVQGVGNNGMLLKPMMDSVPTCQSPPGLGFGGTIFLMAQSNGLDIWGEGLAL